MSTCCENCGYKYNDVKSGGKMQDFGCKLTLTLSEVFFYFYKYIID